MCRSSNNTSEMAQMSNEFEYLDYRRYIGEKSRTKLAKILPHQDLLFHFVQFRRASKYMPLLVLNLFCMKK